jgi:hypothetical protein
MNTIQAWILRRGFLRGLRLGGRAGSGQPDHGATAVEYALMVGLIAVVIAVSVAFFGESVSRLFIIPAGTF